MTKFLECEKANDVLMRYTLDCIINCDETSGKIVSPVLRALRDVGSGSPKVETKTNPKSAVTLVGAVSAKGKKLNTAVIAKGKTIRSLKKFHRRRSTPGIPAPKGWMTGKAMIEWVSDVLVPYAHGRTMCLSVTTIQHTELSPYVIISPRTASSSFWCQAGRLAMFSH